MDGFRTTFSSINKTTFFQVSPHRTYFISIKIKPEKEEEEKKRKFAKKMA